MNKAMKIFAILGTVCFIVFGCMCGIGMAGMWGNYDHTAEIVATCFIIASLLNFGAFTSIAIWEV